MAQCIDDPLTSVLRDGARRLLAQAVEAEAEVFLAAMQDERLADGRAGIVRHGLGPKRAIQTRIGSVPVRRVKLRDRGADATHPTGVKIPFTSAILPKLQRSRSGRDRSRHPFVRPRHDIIDQLTVAGIDVGKPPPRSILTVECTG